MVHVLHNNRVKFPKGFLVSCSLHQYGGNDVSENHLTKIKNKQKQKKN